MSFKRSRRIFSRHKWLSYCLLAGLFLVLFHLPTFMHGGALAEEAKAAAAGAGAAGAPAEAHFQYFKFMDTTPDPRTGKPLFSDGERIALFATLGIAFAGLGYALMLMYQIRGADLGTPKMQEIADAVREGANAYLKRQLTTVLVMILILVGVLFMTKAMAGKGVWDPFAWGRAGAFLMGALFSGTVGFVGMRLATTGNLRVAAAAPVGFGKALMLGYRTGTITGMLTDGLGLLGGTLIFMTYGEHAYEALLGFGFGGTLLALFMRVGGGIYTKAADVGADLVGKVEAGIPEDDPRNAATIADNVGDNVVDCAGMAADIFESYEVTIVAAMILGFVAFGHKGVMFPILVRAIGVVGSIISTYSVRVGDRGNVAEAMKSINFGFMLGSTISVIGFMILGYFYLHFDTDPTRPWVGGANIPSWANFGIEGLDMRPAYTCFIGIILCIALNRTTEYFTGTEYSPVKGLVRNCTTGHATNIIEGFAVGYESSVVTAIILSVAIIASVLVYAGTNPICIAYGVAMCGIGMLTLTGNTISMDVFGPVADNANGIGEMGYEKEKMLGCKEGATKEEHAAKYKEARQILADLDAVGNTTKAVTKGVAIGSAVIAAVSLYASFITVIGSGGGGEEKALPIRLFDNVAAMLTVSNPTLLVGMLIGGAVPMLFSAMTIRAVGRAAYLIVNECRRQFHIPGVMEGTVKPEYGKVVYICTEAAQKELVGPALLAVFAPVVVGFLLGPLALAGFLAGAIVVGQLMASFMCNSGGAWDNAKKTVEDEPRDAEKNTGKGSEKHKASVTGDTVGDPLKDTAGPAINPLLKVMNMVAILTVPLMALYDKTVVLSVHDAAAKLSDAAGAVTPYILPKPFEEVADIYLKNDSPSQTFRVVALVVGIAALAWAYWQSKRETGGAEGAK
ncbi:MAG: sodium-translocating pyrophosphatase [Planctomycetota bacterium]|nr:sodium-translocating pyrophosphatase [Planctomycetota bacterium]